MSSGKIGHQTLWKFRGEVTINKNSKSQHYYKQAYQRLYLKFLDEFYKEVGEG